MEAETTWPHIPKEIRQYIYFQTHKISFRPVLEELLSIRQIYIGFVYNCTFCRRTWPRRYYKQYWYKIPLDSNGVINAYKSDKQMYNSVCDKCWRYKLDNVPWMEFNNLRCKEEVAVLMPMPREPEETYSWGEAYIYITKLNPESMVGFVDPTDHGKIVPYPKNTLWVQENINVGRLNNMQVLKGIK